MDDKWRLSRCELWVTFPFRRTFRGNLLARDSGAWFEMFKVVFSEIQRGTRAGKFHASQSHANCFKSIPRIQLNNDHISNSRNEYLNSLRNFINIGKLTTKRTFGRLFLRLNFYRFSSFFRGATGQGLIYFVGPDEPRSAPVSRSD